MIVRVLSLVAAAILLLTACGADSASENDDRGAGLGASSSPSTWETKFADNELALFEEALARLEECTKSTHPFYAEGRASEASAEVFRECFVDGDARQEELRNLGSNGITFGGTAEVWWSRPVNVAIEMVTIERCVTDATVLKDGEELPPAGPTHPFLVRTTLVRTPGGDLRIEGSQPVMEGQDNVRCADEDP